MKRLAKTILPILIVSGVLLMTSFKRETEVIRYKCLLQMVNYTGEGAYIIVSLINPEGQYDETLYIMGDDPEWYHEIDQWWSYFGKKKRQVDGITGATLSGGDRKMFTFNVDASKLDKGYKIRFETSVEDQKYYPREIEIPYNSSLPTDKVKGKGYIRYVRLLAQ